MQVTDVLDRGDSATQVLNSLVLTSHRVQHRTDGVLYALFDQLRGERPERLGGQGRLSDFAFLFARPRRRLHYLDLGLLLFV